MKPIAGEPGLMHVRTGLRSGSDGRILNTARRKRLGKWTRLPAMRWGSRVLRVTGESRSRC